MDERFLECCFNSQHNVLGYKLTPYSLSHLLVLESKGNPLATGVGKITAPHLVDALIVCSVEQFPFHPNKVGTYSRVVRGMLNGNRRLFAGALMAFRAYQDDFLKTPEFWDDPDDLDNPPGDEGSEGQSDTRERDVMSGPYVLEIACSVMMSYPQISEHRAWTMGLGLLLWYGAQAAALKSGRKLWSDEAGAEIEAGLQAAEAAITPEMRAKAAALKARHEAGVKVKVGVPNG